MQMRAPVETRPVPTQDTQAPVQPLRFISAASLFDGHDAAINLIRRLLQAEGAEVVHLGHNRAVEELVRAAIDEDADGIAVSSYQGGHLEYFTWLIDVLRERGAGHVRVVVGGGGTIAPHEIATLEAHGIEKIYTPEDGRRLGLAGMIGDVMQRVAAVRRPPYAWAPVSADDPQHLGRTISVLEGAPVATGADGDAIARRSAAMRREILAAIAAGPRRTPVVGITGTGGSGKSSLTDELLLRLLRHFPRARVAVLAVDPTRRRSGGALLGDRIRMNSLAAPQIFMRSLATRRRHLATTAVLQDVVGLCQLAGFDLVLVETAGVGQSDSEIVDLVDLPVYVMTSDYGAASQLEKIDMLDFAEFVVLNKFERRGAEDALRDVRRQWRRNHPQQAALPDEALPVFPTVASQFADPGVDRLFAALCARLDAAGPGAGRWRLEAAAAPLAPRREPPIPEARVRHLAEIAAAGRDERRRIEADAETARRAFALYESLRALGDPDLPEPFERPAAAPQTAASTSTIGVPGPPAAATAAAQAAASVAGASGPPAAAPAAPVVAAGRSAPAAALEALREACRAALDALGEDNLAQLRAWPARARALQAEEYGYSVRGRELRVATSFETLSHSRVPKLLAPRDRDWGAMLSFLRLENLPGAWPYTAGVYPYRREQEEPIRMFAGEGAPERTNRRFHYLARGHAATRLSTAFDSTTLYGEDPDTRPDVYGRTGNSGVSIATLDDMKKLYSGFDLCAPSTSVSMTINGPAPMLLAMFMETAVDQQVERFLRREARWSAAEARIAALHAPARAAGLAPSAYRGELPPGHDGSGLALLGLSGAQLVAPGVLEAGEYAALRADTLRRVRGTVQADILKEDQAQNTCIFSTGFALRLMGDVQQWFIDHDVRNFYSVSISGYHIAEAGANPVTQLAFTLANGFTIVEYFLARGMRVDDFAPNLSFFFSSGMDAEYAVLGRVARRIWARALRERYGAAPRSQMLKYHVQTSGRSLHAREVQFNDTRTTLQALTALFDNCNSLHTNAYDEALTTPTEESVRRAVAIQLIINREFGLNQNHDPWAGSLLIGHLTDLVEEAVYREFDVLAARGGVLGAMETTYQRGRIQEESLHYETLKHDGRLPIVGVNTFLDGNESGTAPPPSLVRSTEEEKAAQVEAVRAFQARRAADAPAALAALQRVALEGGNVFDALVEAVRHASLGQITQALYAVGGRYRRSL